MNRLMYFLFVFTVFFFGYFSSFAQTNIGVRTGVHFGKIKTTEDGKDGDVEQQAARGFEVSIPFEFVRNQNFSIMTELSLIQKGAAYREVSKDGAETEKSVSSVFLRYLNIPVLFKYKKDIGSFYAYGNGGIYGGFLLDTRIRARSKAIDEEHNVKVVVRSNAKIEIQETAKRRDVGLVFGGGVGKNFSFGTIFLDARYQFSFIDIHWVDPEHPNPELLPNITEFHRGISLTIGVLKTIGGE